MSYHKPGEYGVLQDKHGHGMNKVNGAPISSGPVLCIECGKGTIVASVGGDAGEYDELMVDLVKPDGSIIQLAVIGMDERLQEMHVYAYDGQQEEVADTTIVTIDGNSVRY